MHKIKHNLTLAQKRKQRVSRKLYGTAKRPRLTVLRSNKYLYAQVIDDDKMQTLVASNELMLKKSLKGNKTQRAQEIAKDLAQKLVAKKIKAVVFDRGSYKYHGRIKALAQALRAEGITI